MNPAYIRTVLLLCLAALTDMQAQEAELIYRLEPGASYFLKSDLQQSTHSESIDSEEISFYNLTRLEFRVDSIDRDNLIYMRVGYRDLLISMLAPQMEIDISSASGRDTILSRMVDLLEQGTFHMVMTARGEMVSLKGLEELFTPLATIEAKDTTEQQVVMKTLEEAYGPDAFRSLCNVFLYVYPVIYPMSNWTNDITYYFNTKAVKMVNRYVLARSTNESVVIQGLGMLNSMDEFYETTGMGKVKSAVSGSQTYDFSIDPGSGWLQRCVSRQRVMIETTILESRYFPPGLKIPSYTETTFEVTGGRMKPVIKTEKK